jgi:hypothetical protein
VRFFHSSGELLVSQERTVRKAAWHLRKQAAIGEMHGITMTSSRTVPAHHDFGMRMAIGVLEKSLKAAP